MKSLFDLSSIVLIKSIEDDKINKLKKLNLPTRLIKDINNAYENSMLIEFIIAYDTAYLCQFKMEKFKKDLTIIKFFEFHKKYPPPNPSNWWIVGKKRVWLHAKGKDCIKLFGNGYTYVLPLDAEMIPAIHLAVKNRREYVPMRTTYCSSDDDMDSDQAYCNHDFNKAHKEMMDDYNKSVHEELIHNILEIRSEF